MSRIVLHVGIHKTGTTSIQDTLCANIDRLAETGLVYPRPQYGTGHHELLSGRAEMSGLLPLAYSPDGGADALWQKILRDHAGSDRTVIISSEVLSKHGGDVADRMAWLARLTAPFDERVVVCMLRNQVALIQSIYLEIAKKRAVPPFSQSLADACEKGGFLGTLTDFTQYFDVLAGAFGAEAVTVLNYDELAGRPNGVVDALLAQARPGASIDTLGLQPGPWSNRSAEPLAVLAARLVQPDHALSPALVARAEAALRTHFGRDLRTTLFSRAEIAPTRDHFTPHNNRLRARLQQVGQDITLDFPDWSDRVHREDINAGFWLELCRHLQAAA